MRHLFACLLALNPTVTLGGSEYGWNGIWQLAHGNDVCTMTDFYLPLADESVVPTIMFVAFVDPNLAREHQRRIGEIFVQFLFHPTEALPPSFRQEMKTVTQLRVADSKLERLVRDGSTVFRLAEPNSLKFLELLEAARSVPIVATTGEGAEVDLSIPPTKLTQFKVAYAMFKACVDTSGA